MAARLVNPDRSSEGICTTRYMRALRDLGDVVCVTSDESLAPSARGCESKEALIPVEPQWDAPPMYWFDSHQVEARRARGFREMSLVSYLATGLSALEVPAIAGWIRALRAAKNEVRPDVVVARGAGECMDPLVACALMGTEWIGHIHDPWPLSYYPDPYRGRGVGSAQRERLCRWMLGRAQKLVFPAGELASWMQYQTGLAIESKSVVVPHAGEESRRDTSRRTDRPAGSVLWLTHAGTLLTPRDPTSLLEAILRHNRRQGAGGVKIGFRQVGGIGRPVEQSVPYRELSRQLRGEGLFKESSERLSMDESLDLISDSEMALILERGRPVAPCLTLKLADLATIGVPIFAASPRWSVTRSILGAGHSTAGCLDDPKELDQALDSASDLATAGGLTSCAVGREEAGRFTGVLLRNSIRESFK